MYFKLDYNVNIALYSFHEYNMLISIYCEMITAISLINVSHHIELEKFFPVVGTFKIDSLSNSQIYVMINYSHHYIARTLIL